MRTRAAVIAATLVLGACTLGCGAISGADRHLWGDTRAPNPVERTYTSIAAGSGSPLPCSRISPDAVAIDDAAEPGLQVILERARCLSLAAQAAGDPELCAEVESVSTLRLDGSDFDAERCRRGATGEPVAGVEPPAIELLMTTLGFETDELAERCDHFLRVNSRASLEAEQEAYVRCVQERPGWLREHPDDPYPICTGPFNRLERYEDCVETRTRELEADPGLYPENYVDRCRLFLGRATPAQRRFDLCVDRERLARHRVPGPNPDDVNARCRERAFTFMRDDMEWGRHGFCVSLAEPDPDTFQWRVAEEALRDGPDWRAIYGQMLAAGEVVARLDRLPNHAVEAPDRTNPTDPTE